MKFQTKTEWSPGLFRDYYNNEHDACGIVAFINRSITQTRDTIDIAAESLRKMNHRAGFTNGEGDGVGIQTDIPTLLWQEKLTSVGISPEVVSHPSFTVGHFFLDDKSEIQTLLQIFEENGYETLYHSCNQTFTSALGPIAQAVEPEFLQVALLPIKNHQITTLFDLTNIISKKTNVTVVSLSQSTCVYKVMGTIDTLLSYYSDLQHPNFQSSVVVGHNRYSTNTSSSFSRVQPFSMLAHNGEINTIEQLRIEAKQIGANIKHGNSDSQDVNITLETLIHKYNYSLKEAMELLFPPVPAEYESDPEVNSIYNTIRSTFGPYCQGPAGVLTREGNEFVASVDALGLRPVWLLETNDYYVFSSEQGILSPELFISEPHALSPGEKVGINLLKDRAQLLTHRELSHFVTTKLNEKLTMNLANKEANSTDYVEHSPPSIHPFEYGAFGWQKEQIQLVEQMAEKGAEPIRSLGHDAPLACLDEARKNLSDFMKETVAVVTNPAIDRDRETEHFSISVILGKRPSITKKDSGIVLQLPSPIIGDGFVGNTLKASRQQISYEEILNLYQLENKLYKIQSTFSNLPLEETLSQYKYEAIEAVKNGAECIVITDDEAHKNNQYWIDPALITAIIHNGLVNAKLRRNCSIILKTAAVRNLHDLMVMKGLGADAINPHFLFGTISELEAPEKIVKLYDVLNKGIEKVISTIGMHELRGYAKMFSSIGLQEDIASSLGVINFFGDQTVSGFKLLEADSKKRSEDYNANNATMPKSFHVFPRIWKAIGETAQTGSYETYRQKLNQIEEERPTTVRHALSLVESSKPVDSSQVSLEIGTHSLPFIISSMSFGSQNEVAFRAYAEGANRLNMISLNGEGGEIQDMIGKYPNTRGQQIASGRFGVNANLLHSSNLIEIKIGQGAKPGEGGHLPASKVTQKIAETRNATLGSDLISPSNNHDIYSIEDLAQMISEIKAVNPKAKVAVKVPVVPNIGTIAVGIAKAGANFINISGFDGGTGAARVHAIQNVGLPVEIGVRAAHNALLESGLRNSVEIWADGGMKSVNDVVKMMILGANRIGFGTLSMIAIGCTTCRGCHLDTCHVGIATQIESEIEAMRHGLRKFTPRQLETAVTNLVQFFTAFKDELQVIVGSLGVKNAQDLVGKTEFLKQTRFLDTLNLTNLLSSIKIEKKEYVLSNGESAKVLQSNDVGVFAKVDNEYRHAGSLLIHDLVVKKQTKGVASPVEISFEDQSIPGNGLGTYTVEDYSVFVQGGAQDGVAKTAFGGTIFISKALGANGQYFGGSVGKCFAYGAQKGQFFIQGNADSRAGIRLSGADVVIGGRNQSSQPISQKTRLGAKANINGFAFEYMTGGRAVVLGDPGPWMCAGMTGGVIYVRNSSELGLTKEAYQNRIAKGASVSIVPVDETGKNDLNELLVKYISLLTQHNQHDEAEFVQSLLDDIEQNFLQIKPKKEQADPSVSTE
ncbi:glutamate synthase-related protein [Gottfriedia acidiceleris]|uniref:Glutamate synthase-related protein n=1 Tax=Gottfriedia acidiceleris TaxID=371036 RepID=A0ABY4JM37_9BACI|nr:glutamate synthase-related protein [Gottfriedia acidiceleris]UPM54915.1 glutamate synthase-related protein [Gottfriedia acidiceleris]